MTVLDKYDLSNIKKYVEYKRAKPLLYQLPIQINATHFRKVIEIIEKLDGILHLLTEKSIKNNDE